VIVGKSLINSKSGSLRAFRWTASTGMRDLKHELVRRRCHLGAELDAGGGSGRLRRRHRHRRLGYPGSLTPAQPFVAVLPAPGSGGGGSGTSLSSLTLSRFSVTGGNSLTGTVRLTAAAPTGGAKVTLTSNDPPSRPSRPT